MAIVKTEFTCIDQYTNVPEIAAWLEENAAEYFDSMELTEDESGYPIFNMKIGETTAVKFTANATASYGISTTVTLSNGTNVKTSVNANRPKYFDYAKKTENGVYLHSPSSDRLFFTKTNAGSTAFALFYSSSSYYIADFTYSDQMKQYAKGDNMCMPNSLTSFAPVVLDGGTYCPAMFRTPDSEYAGTDCNMVFDGVNYAYDGYIALKE